MIDKQKENLGQSSSTREPGAVLSLLVAASENNVIGKDNKLPWHLPDDLKYFKNLTWGMPILMGRKTFESIGKILPGRNSIVITRNNNWQQEGVYAVHSIDEAVHKAEGLGAKEIFVIGGAEIFNTSLSNASRIYLTRIHQPFEGDAFFPEISKEVWKPVSSRFCKADEKNAYDHTYEIWERI